MALFLETHAGHPQPSDFSLSWGVPLRLPEVRSSWVTRVELSGERSKLATSRTLSNAPVLDSPLLTAAIGSLVAKFFTA